jgi:hypothetical protein
MLKPVTFYSEGVKLAGAPARRRRGYRARSPRWMRPASASTAPATAARPWCSSPPSIRGSNAWFRWSASATGHAGCASCAARTSTMICWSAPRGPCQAREPRKIRHYRYCDPTTDAQTRLDLSLPGRVEQNDPNRTDHSAPKSGDRTRIRRVLRLVEFRSIRPISSGIRNTCRYGRSRIMKVTTAPAGRSGQASRSPGDEIGPYTDTQLRKMDDAFVAAVTVAFATGKESPQVACATVQAAPRDVGRRAHVRRPRQGEAG